MPGVFVCYRREVGVESASGRLRDALAGEFGAERVFMDVDSVRPGEDWVDAIEEALAVSDVVLAVIHPEWVNDDRLADPDDVLRLEIESGLRRGLLVVPVLVNDASPPRLTELPEPLAGLARRQAIPLRHETWHSDILPLMEAVRVRLEEAAEQERSEREAAAAEQERLKRETEAAEQERLKRETEAAEQETPIRQASAASVPAPTTAWPEGTHDIHDVPSSLSNRLRQVVAWVWRSELHRVLFLGLVAVAGIGLVVVLLNRSDGADLGGAINVAMVGNPQMEDIASLTPELFTAETGIEVNYTLLEEQTLREIVTRDVGAGGEQFDVVMIGMFEAPQFGANGWMVDLNEFAADDPDYNVDDIIPAVRGGLSFEDGLHGAPFYAESSFVMYRQDVLDEAGLTMPDAPTWDEVAEIARAVDSDEMAGICLRGKPGWADLGSSFTTMLNTFGGTWWAANDDGSIGEAQVDQPEFEEALDFYVNLINDAGQDDAANASFIECLNLYQNGEVAMWYDSTVAAGILEGDDSPIQGLNGYALAPTKVTEASGWLWAWALGIPTNAPDPETAWEYVSWATSEDYINEAGEALPGGWATVPPGTRQSTYENPNYQEAAGTFADKTLDAMLAAPIDNPGTTPRPGVPGVQYVGVPEFPDVGNRCTEQFSAAIAGSTSVDDALSACQAIASEVSS